jgi:hypothetical protein
MYLVAQGDHASAGQTTIGTFIIGIILYTYQLYFILMSVVARIDETFNERSLVLYAYPQWMIRAVYVYSIITLLLFTTLTALHRTIVEDPTTFLILLFIILFLAFIPYLVAAITLNVLFLKKVSRILVVQVQNYELNKNDQSNNNNTTNTTNTTGQTATTGATATSTDVELAVADIQTQTGAGSGAGSGAGAGSPSIDVRSLHSVIRYSVLVSVALLFTIFSVIALAMELSGVGTRPQQPDLTPYTWTIAVQGIDNVVNAVVVCLLFEFSSPWYRKLCAYPKKWFESCYLQRLMKEKIIMDSINMGSGPGNKQQEYEKLLFVG